MCDYVIRQEPIAAAEIMPAGTGTLTHNVYCQRASQFWVQSLTSTHNMHACPHHLARIVREIEKCAREYDILSPDYLGTENLHPAYVRVGQSTTRRVANYARVTVKTYTPKGR